MYVKSKSPPIPGSYLVVPSGYLVVLMEVGRLVGRYVFFGQVMSSHHSDQMSQRSQVSRIAPFGCSLMEVHM